VIAGSVVTPSAVDVEWVDLAPPFHCFPQLLLCFVQVPLARLEKPHQSAQVRIPPALNIIIIIISVIIITD